mmetsp:Transcript_5423/g.15936  ORF Transcript_5423/g.15936 Transcript_5423/m.15936 type:complete len:85 (-) Transcript_5423:448-702(-)|eukprot:CAMPEP_0119545364 /NCGR_PEP_ID=MMETSP1352-20130426/124_1 /TAXON_ID=265584 /ORGANISM="Stauroneis constricta, Strain CCMP1120" /LENGTH=84 /DNA_ID=CAMNT_0007589899 /DNA_START=134 /DNA_END=388 /DNA_ORIENTATION=+
MTVSHKPEGTLATSGAQLSLVHQPSHARWVHRPIISAILMNNSLRNCDDVFKMMDECNHAGSSDRICQTASSYFDMCVNGSHEE